MLACVLLLVDHMDGDGYVLVVDDEPGIRALVQTPLDADGIAIQAAADGATGLSLAEEATPAVELLDYMLPDVDGVQLGAALRARLGSGLPLIFMSALRIPDATLTAVDAFLFLSKPFDIDSLLPAVKAALSPRQPQSLRLHSALPRDRRLTDTLAR